MASTSSKWPEIGLKNQDNKANKHVLSKEAGLCLIQFRKLTQNTDKTKRETGRRELQNPLPEESHQTLLRGGGEDNQPRKKKKKNEERLRISCERLERTSGRLSNKSFCGLRPQLLAESERKVERKNARNRKKKKGGRKEEGGESKFSSKARPSNRTLRSNQKKQIGRAAQDRGQKDAMSGGVLS